ncbi:MAG: hypothetical protein WBO37_09390 [Gammaproteobacteria bacterium]
MYKSLSMNALVAAALIGIAVENAWSDQATPNGSVIPATPTPAPVSGYQPGWYPPPPWPMPPPAYGQQPPFYPPYGQYRAVPTAPAENPLNAELEQTREQLAAMAAELDTANATLEQSQLRLQLSLEAERTLNEKLAIISNEQQALQVYVTELTAERERQRDALASRDKQFAALQAEHQTAMKTLQQAQSGNMLSSQQLGSAMAQADSLKSMLSDLKTRLESQQTTLQNTGRSRTANHDSLTSKSASHDGHLTSSQAETPAAPQVQAGTTGSDPLPGTARAQAGASNTELTELRAQMENLKLLLRNTGNTLATVTAERDGLLADMTAVVTERDGLQEQLAACRRELARAGDATTSTRE